MGLWHDQAGLMAMPEPRSNSGGIVPGRSRLAHNKDTGELNYRSEQENARGSVNFTG